MRADQLAYGLQVFGLIDPAQHNRQVAGDTVRPKRRWSEIVPFQDFGRRPQRQVRVDDAIGETLEQVRLVRRNSEMVELNLSLGPSQCGRTFESRNIMMLIGQADNLDARTSKKCPKRNTNGGAGWNAHASANAEDRIEYRPDRVRKRPAAADGNRRADAVATSKEARPIGLELQPAGGLTFQYGQMRGPYLRFIRRPPSAGRQQRAKFRHELGLYKKL